MRQIAWLPDGTIGTTVHRLGFWSTDLSEKSGSKMPEAALLILDEADCGVYLFRYSAEGVFAGDTWHETLEDARNQAVFEYGNVSWMGAPEGPAEIDEFATACVAGRKAE